MFKELSCDQFERVKPLFTGFDYSLSIRAAMEGNNPGRIFVDDVEHPRTAFGLTVEGYLLAGEHDNPATLESLRAFIHEKLFTGEVFVNGDDSLSLAVHPEAWEARLPELIPTHEAEKLERYHYLCRELAFDWRAALPDGYTVRRIDRDLLEADDIIIPEAIGEWNDAEEYWGSVENFLTNGIGFCVLHENQIVAQCTADCFAGEQIDIGIVTAPVYRHKGLASIAAAAAARIDLGQECAGARRRPIMAGCSRPDIHRPCSSRPSCAGPAWSRRSSSACWPALPWPCCPRAQARRWACSAPSSFPR